MFLKLLNTSNEEVKLNPMQIAFYSDSHVTFSNGLTMEFPAEAIKEIDKAVLPRTRSKKDNAPKSELNELFDELVKLTGGKTRAIFTPAREKQLDELMTKHRMTKEDVIRAATNIGKNEWLQGKNKQKTRYGDIDYLLRSDKAAKYASEEAENKRKMF